jgi:hypothetical protein
LKAGEVSRHDECSLVAVTVAAYVTDNFTDVQKVSLSRQSVSSPPRVILVLPKLSLIGTDVELDEEGERRYEFGCLVADVVPA